MALGVCCRAYEVVERRIAPWPGWRNPTDAQPQQAFVDLSDGQRGLMIANRGLPEYEVLRDGHGTLALTLLRCVGHLGDWGVFATTVAQCPGPWAAEYAILPHTGTWSEAARWAREYVTLLHAGQAWPNMAPTAQRGAGLPDEASFLRIEGEALVLAACKQAEDRASIVVRLYNPTGDPCRGTLTSLLPLAVACFRAIEYCLHGRAQSDRHPGVGAGRQYARVMGTGGVDGASGGHGRLRPAGADGGAPASRARY